MAAPCFQGARLLLLLLGFAGATDPGSGTSLSPLVINEISDSGTPGFCGGDDWVEVALSASEASSLDISGYKLCDSDGCGDSDAYRFASSTIIAPGGYLAVCHTKAAGFNQTTRRWIGKNDTISLYDASNMLVDTVGPLGGLGEWGYTYARSPDMTGGFTYTWAPTPGAAYAGEGSNTVCDRIARGTPTEEGGNCTACVDDAVQPWPKETACTGPARTAADDFEAEKKALFGNKQPPALWNATSFLFKDETLWNIELQLDQAAWDRMRDAPADEAYEVGGVRIAGLGTWTGVGIRFKGFFGSLRLCLIGWVNCNKLSYKLKFDYVNPAQRFFGLKRLQLHASINDPTLMRERLSYSLFREFGVPTVRQTYCTVKRVGADGSSSEGGNLGVHIMTEVLDGRWTEAFFKGNGDGNLYKEVWPTLSGVSTERKTAYFTQQLRTNSGADANGGTGPNVQRMVDFGDAVEDATDDVELAAVIKEYSAAKDWARYFAVDRAIEHWDGPSNFRREGSTAWTHNFFTFEDEDETLSTREVRLIPWDLDGTWNAPSGGTTGARPAFDAPVCSPKSPGSTGQQKDSPTKNCIMCSSFESTGGLSQSFPPSCLRINRAFFGRGLRHEYMKRAKQLMEGPLQKCRITAKLERWKAQIQDAVAADAASGMYPAMREQGATTFDYQFNQMLTSYVPDQVERFRRSVRCGAGGSRYAPGDWGDMYSIPVGEMIKDDFGGMQFGGWGGGGPKALSAGQIIPIVVLVLICIGTCVCLYVKRRSCYEACCSTTPSPKTPVVSATSTPYVGATATMRVDVPAGVMAGQSMLVASPHGGNLVVAVPQGCTAFTVTCPEGTAASRAVGITILPGAKLGIDLYADAMSGGAHIRVIYPGTPAFLAGLRKGERLVTINGAAVPVANSVEAAKSMLKGAMESATSFTMEVSSFTPTVAAAPMAMAVATAMPMEIASAAPEPAL